MTEKKLLHNLKLGKTTAYEYLFSVYYDWLCNYIYNLCGDRSLTEDIVQNTMIVFWQKRQKIKITSSLKNYLFKSCYNEYLQYLRKNKIQFDSLDQMKWDVVSEVSSKDNYDEKIQKLMGLIDQLPPKCKEVFIKNKLENKKYREVAADMNVSIKTVEKHISKALLFLKKNASVTIITIICLFN